MPSNGIEIVSSDLILDSRCRYKQIWDAVQMLSTLPPGKAVTVPTSTHSADLISRKAHVYARRYQMRIMTKKLDGKVVICERRDERKISMGDLAQRCMRNASDRYVKASNQGRAV